MIIYREIQDAFENIMDGVSPLSGEPTVEALLERYADQEAGLLETAHALADEAVNFQGETYVRENVAKAFDYLEHALWGGGEGQEEIVQNATLLFLQRYPTAQRMIDFQGLSTLPPPPLFIPPVPSA